MKSIYLSILISLSTLSVIAQDEAVIYSFKTRNNKIVQFIYNETDSIFKYRLLSRGKIKLEVVDDLKDIDTVFTVHGYHRGGGVQNSAMLTDMCRQP